MQAAEAPMQGGSYSSTLMGASVKPPGISGGQSSAPIPQEYFSSLSSVFHGNRMFFTIAAGGSCEDPGDRQRGRVWRRYLQGKTG